MGRFTGTTAVITGSGRRKGLGEAIAMYLLPQLEGLNPTHATAAWGHLRTALEGEPSAIKVLQARYDEMFPMAKVNAD